ncbi:hypothetical protein ACFFP0_10435 [Rhizobium puerariae]|uniref:Uncharacterized protein n=1 Tax=Rhizobium puerariae TaxID=1585791 RepID=A0ABV6AIV4_9HYPH
MSEDKARRYLEEQVAIYRQMMTEIERDRLDLPAGDRDAEGRRTELAARLHSCRQSLNTLQRLLGQPEGM